MGFNKTNVLPDPVSWVTVASQATVVGSSIDVSSAQKAGISIFSAVDTAFSNMMGCLRFVLEGQSGANSKWYMIDSFETSYLYLWGPNSLNSGATAGDGTLNLTGSVPVPTTDQWGVIKDANPAKWEIVRLCSPNNPFTLQDPLAYDHAISTPVKYGQWRSRYISVQSETAIRIVMLNNLWTSSLASGLGRYDWTTGPSVIVNAVLTLNNGVT